MQQRTTTASPPMLLKAVRFAEMATQLFGREGAARDAAAVTELADALMQLGCNEKKAKNGQLFQAAWMIMEYLVDDQQEDEVLSKRPVI